MRDKIRRRLSNAYAGVLCVLLSCGDSAPHTTFGTGAESVHFSADDRGYALDTLWVVDADVLRAAGLRERIIEAARGLPPPNFGNGHTALLVAHAQDEALTAAAPNCPPSPATAFTSRYCNEARNNDNAGAYVECALAGSAWKSPLAPLDAVSEFLTNDAPDSGGRRFLSEEARLHVVIVALRDDTSIVSTQALVQQLLALKPNFPERIVVTLIVPRPTCSLPRFESVRKLAPGEFIDIAAPVWDWLFSFDLVPSGECIFSAELPPLLVPNTDQCVVQSLDFNSSQRTTGVIKQCAQDHPTLPCWFIKDPKACAQIKIDRGGCLPPPSSGIEVRCVANLPSP